VQSASILQKLVFEVGQLGFEIDLGRARAIHYLLLYLKLDFRKYLYIQKKERHIHKNRCRPRREHTRLGFKIKFSSKFTFSMVQPREGSFKNLVGRPHFLVGMANERTKPSARAAGQESRRSCILEQRGASQFDIHENDRTKGKGDRLVMPVRHVNILVQIISAVACDWMHPVPHQSHRHPYQLERVRPTDCSLTEVSGCGGKVIGQ
jgi:hypothetical protein